jgi:site-specific DNA-cytosine methylase
VTERAEVHAFKDARGRREALDEPRPAPPPRPRARRRKAASAPGRILAGVELPAVEVGKPLGYKVGSKTRKRKGGPDYKVHYVYLQGQWLKTFGFKIGAAYYVDYDPWHRTARVRLGKGRGTPPARKQLTVSKQYDVPTIHLENRHVSELFGRESRVMVQLEDGELTIRPGSVAAYLAGLRRQASAERRRAGQQPVMGSCFTGAGFLDLAGERAGYASAFGIELVPRYAGIYRANRVAEWGGDPARVPIHPVGVGSVVAHNLENLKVQLPPILPTNIDLLVGGIPCQPYSRATKTHGDPVKYWQQALEKGDAAAAHLVALTPRFIQLVQATNPLNVVVEQVPAYEKSQAMIELVQLLEAQGYHVRRVARTDPCKRGLPAGRERFVLVATTDPVAPEVFPRQDVGKARVWKILTPPGRIPQGLSEKRGGWFTLGVGAFGKQMLKLWRSADKAGSHRPTTLHPGSHRVGAITKRYYEGADKGLPIRDAPYVWHPENSSPPRYTTRGVCKERSRRCLAWPEATTRSSSAWTSTAAGKRFRPWSRSRSWGRGWSCRTSRS